ncbi:DNA repair protein RecO [Roseicyclus marinus]|uniref:DNA repair protein RecO n=1 Tax=Roseicyclus marinus TaxID=2161673 RepID=UPI002410046A|nr:DNA repair protein RecO [Roseicyclus marinus]MDG3042649.1 DNA repair protein RecO [Roseicyclus marinus]
MEWRAEGILLNVRRHGEHAAILDLFTKDLGRHMGVLKGGASRKMAPLLQPGAQLDATWRARLDAHLGAYSVDLIRGRAAEAMDDRLSLAGLSAVCALLSFALPERHAYPGLYARTLALLDGLGADRWPEAYLTWELALLEETGFGLDLSACAVTGATQGLAYVSPRTGRAVSAAGAGEWADRLLPLPGALMGLAGGDPVEVVAGLRTTGHFLTDRLAPALGEKPLPPARQRLVDLIALRAQPRST